MKKLTNCERTKKRLLVKIAEIEAILNKIPYKSAEAESQLLCVVKSLHRTELCIHGFSESDFKE
jgi:hypothetical protein